MKYCFFCWIVLLLVFSSGCKTMKTQQSTSLVQIYCYPIHSTSKIPITPKSIFRSAVDTFASNDSLTFDRIIGVLNVSPELNDTLFSRTQVRMALTNQTGDTIYLDRSSSIQYRNKVFALSKQLYEMISQMIPHAKRNTYIEKPS